VTSYSTIQCAVDERGLARVVLDRQRKLNAFDDLMLQELEICVSELNAEPAVKLAVVSGAGGNFCSGRDTGELSEVGLRDSGRLLPASGGHESSMFRALEMPVVAVLDGAVVGGGLGFALQCDLRVATSRVRILDGHLAKGIVPSVAAWYLPRLITTGRALQTFTRHDPITAAEAFAFGLVDEVVEPNELESKVAQICAPFLAADGRLLRHAKALVVAAQNEPYDQAMRQVGLLRAIERLNHG
jgi:enoyl-CoA hydratase/carnithine racemase